MSIRFADLVAVRPFLDIHIEGVFMDINTFASLPYHKQCELLWEEGQFIDSVLLNQFKANLYAISNFFVEIICQPDSTTVEKIQIATDEVLVKYLNCVDVSSLL